MSEIPDPEALLVQALRLQTSVTSKVLQRIDTKLNTVYPCVRITLTGGASRPVPHTGSPSLQWEAWADTEGAAAQLAKAVDGVADELAGSYPAGVIKASYHQGHYFHSPDAATGKQRYIGQIGLLTQ
jgi:hypothetical protein